MSVHGDSSTGSVHAVTVHLTAQYAGVVPFALVAAVVRDAERDLRGQVLPGSLDEMLHRLAAFRLQELNRVRNPLAVRAPAARATRSSA